MKNNRKIYLLIGACLILILAGFGFMFGGRIFTKEENVINSGDLTMPEANAISEEIKGDTIVEQSFRYEPDSISQIAVVFTRKYYLEGVSIVIELREGNNVLASNSYKVEGLEDQHRTFLDIGGKLTGLAGKDLTLRIYSESKKDTGMALMIQENKKNHFSFGKETIKGTLCFTISE